MCVFFKLNEERARVKYRDQDILELKAQYDELKSQLDNLNTLNASQATKISETEIVMQKHEFDAKSSSSKYQQTISALESEIQKLDQKCKEYENTLK